MSYHWVQSAIAAGILKFCHIAGKDNPADILTKSLGHTSMWPHVQPFLFCHRETVPSNKSQIGEWQMVAGLGWCKLLAFAYLAIILVYIFSKERKEKNIKES